MTIQLELWHLVTLLLAFFAMCGAVGKLLLNQFQKHMDTRFADQEAARSQFHGQLQIRLEGIEVAHKAEAGQWARLEREVLELKAELPMNYVRREDYIRGQSVLEAKLDALYQKLENVLMRVLGTKGGLNVD